MTDWPTSLPDADWVSKCGNYRLHNADCLTILPELPAGSVDAVVADLPYGTTKNPWDSLIDLSRLWPMYRRAAQHQAAFVLFGQGMFTATLMTSNPDGFRYKLVWHKSKATNFLNAKRQPLRKHEDICVFYDAPPTYNPQMAAGEAYDKGVRKDQRTGSYGDFKPAHIKSEGARYPTDVIYHATAESEGPVFHGTQKPVGLIERLVLTYSDHGDVIIDNAMGSGTTGVACVQTGRKFIGVELEEKYFSIAVKRIERELSQGRIPFDSIEAGGSGSEAALLPGM